MTGAQASYLKTLCDEAGEAFDDTLTKAEASKRIEELQAMTGRGIDHRNPETALRSAPITACSLKQLRS
jgi:hypothetical protein